jgi:hypothetical protein
MSDQDESSRLKKEKKQKKKKKDLISAKPKDEAPKTFGQIYSSNNPKK